MFPSPSTAPVEGQRSEANVRHAQQHRRIWGLCRFFKTLSFALRSRGPRVVSGHYRSVRYRHVGGASSGKPTVNPIELGGPGSTLTLRRSDSASPAVDDRSPGFGAAARSTANAADHDCTATTAAITTTAAMGATTATGTDDDGGRDGDGDRRERRATAGRTTAEDATAVTAMVAAAVAAAAAVTTIHSPRRPGRTRGGEGKGG